MLCTHSHKTHAERESQGQVRFAHKDEEQRHKDKKGGWNRVREGMKIYINDQDKCCTDEK